MIATIEGDRILLAPENIEEHELLRVIVTSQAGLRWGTVEVLGVGLVAGGIVSPEPAIQWEPEECGN